jgi:hypothetical protein
MYRILKPTGSIFLHCACRNRRTCSVPPTRCGGTDKVNDKGPPRKTQVFLFEFPAFVREVCALPPAKAGSSWLY